MKIAKRSYLVYVGTFFDEAIVRERGLPSRNAAGSNRMVRVSEALRSAGLPVIMLSPGISSRVSWQGHLSLPSRLRRMGSVPVLFSRALGLPLIGMLCEGWFLLYSLNKIASKREIQAVMLYNFPPSFILLALYMRIFMRKVSIIHNIEDISKFHWRDWLPSTPVRPFRQLLLAISMNILVRLSAGVIVPSRRFLTAIPTSKAHLVISGCMPDLPVEVVYSAKKVDLRLRVLYSGSIELENGIAILIDALEIINKTHELAAKLSVDICGSGTKVEWVQKKIAEMKNCEIEFHGFVTDQKYRQLLADADICLALQDPAGRYGTTNTPSKVYEYLGNGKLVIATDVGDIAQIPEDVLTLCDPLTKKNLLRILCDIVNTPERVARQGATAACYARKHFSYSVVGKQMNDFIDLTKVG